MILILSFQLLALCFFGLCNDMGLAEIDDQYRMRFPWKPLVDGYHPRDLEKMLNHCESSYSNSKFGRSLLSSTEYKSTPIYISFVVSSFRYSFFIHTLKSLLSGSVLPDHIYILASKDPFLMDQGIEKAKFLRDKELMKLIVDSKLITIVYTSNIGPHRKLVPLLAQVYDMNAIIVTVDDDVIYSSKFLEDMLRSYVDSGGTAVVAPRTRRIGLCTHSRHFSANAYLPDEVSFSQQDNWILATYAASLSNLTYFGNTPENKRKRAKKDMDPSRVDVVWPLTTPSYQEMLVLPTGTSGVLYHSSFLKPEVVFDETAIRITETGDDIHLRIAGIANNVGVVGLSNGLKGASVAERVRFDSKRTKNYISNLFNKWLQAPEILVEYEKNMSLSNRHIEFEGGNRPNRQLALKGLWLDMNGNDKNNKMMEASAAYFKSKGLFDLSVIIDQYVTHDRFECLTMAIHSVERMNVDRVTLQFLHRYLQLNGRITRDGLMALVESSLHPVGGAYRKAHHLVKDAGVVFHDIMQKCGFFHC